MYKIRYKSHHDASRALKARFEIKTDKTEYVAGLLSSPASSRRVIYIHVPFCTKICSFCPFHRPDELSRREYDKYIINEIDRISGFEYMRAPIDAINFGGGTPTALCPEQMSRILEKLHKSFDVRQGAEISVETSITELTDDMASALKDGGVNRISIGVQTFDNDGRKLLGRRGSGEAAVERIIKTKTAGFENIGIDLIYNYPGQTERSLMRDVETIKSLGLAGISFYSLMLHDGTPIVSKISGEQLDIMNNVARERELFDIIVDGLYDDGYRFFELTKLIRNDLDRYDYIRIRHAGGSCVAVGHGAGGNIENYVYHNSVHSSLLGENAPISSMGRVLEDKYFILDEFINDLQKMTVDINIYSRRLGFDLLSALSKNLEDAQNEGLITLEGSRVTLTNDGIFWGNNFIDELIGRILTNSNGA